MLGEPNVPDIRARFIAVSHGEYAAELSGIAAPVLSFGQKCEGAIAVTGLTSRFTPERIAAIQLDLLATAIELTKAFGGRTDEMEKALERAGQAENP
jgi:DNA-binding IclR family transcriptional regulator